MRHIHNKIFICAALATAPFVMSAQNDVQAETIGQPADSVYMVQTAFRTMAQDDLLGGVDVVNVEELLGKNYFLNSLDNMSSLVGGWNGTSLWGMSSGEENNRNLGYLVLIDGVPRAANNVQPSEIAQITFLKGANAVVLYGSRAAKGAILITTKRGVKSEKLKIDLNVNTGLHVAKSYPEYLGSAEYLTYYNQALVNDGKAADIKEEEITNHATGNKYRYPSLDYYSSDYISKVKDRQEAILELSGGGERARFYSNINAYTAGDYVKAGDAKENRINRLSVRGNVDVAINDYIKAHINANATYYDSKNRLYNSDPSKGVSYWSAAASTRPNYPANAAPLIPISKITDSTALELVLSSKNIFDGYFLGGTKSDQTNVFSQIYAGGTIKFTSRQFQFNGGVDFDLRELLQGLSFRADLAMDFKTSYNTLRRPTAYAVFEPKWKIVDGEEVIVGVTKYGSDDDNGQQELYDTHDDRTLAMTAQFNYDRSFGAHNVSAIALVNAYQQMISGKYHAITNANMGFDVSYNFAHRYYLQASAAIAHSAKLAEGHRNALSPAITLGWDLAKESFLENSIFDKLLLSASLSSLNEDIDIDGYYLGNDSDGYYLYNGLWEKNTWSYTWYDGSNATAITPTRGDNEKMSMIKRNEFSVNLKASMFNRFVTADLSFFKNTMDGYLVNTSKEWPSHLQKFISYLNNDVNERYGFDFAVNFNKRVGEVDLSLGVVGLYYDNKIVTKEETRKYDYQKREGNPIDAIWGLKSDGLFQSQAEIDAAPTHSLGSKVRPGDIRYIDQNGDNKVTADDEVCLGRWGSYGSPLTMGVNLTAKYKNFTLFVLGSARSGGYGMKNSSYYWMNSKTAKYSAIARESWTSENTNAEYPALSASNFNNNYRNSDFWMYKNNAFTLDKVQLSYELPKEILGESFVKGVSAFISGSSLLTISKESKHMEMSVGSEPQSRFYNLGIKATF